MKQKKRIIVIGGGAAGFYGAIRAASCNPGAVIQILEKSSKLLSKVKVSGGGRCNVTHNCFHAPALAAHYPRGEKLLKRLFQIHGPADTLQWFLDHQVPLHAESDGRMFPRTNSSQTIIDCFLQEVHRLGIDIQTNAGVQNIAQRDDGVFVLQVGDRQLLADKVLISTGGAAKAAAYEWLKDLGHNIELPVPSLFTFNIPDPALHQLAGVSVPQAAVRIESTRWNYEGPLLITHWGLSGPAILKLSAFGARWVHEQNYSFKIQLRWIPLTGEEELRQHLQQYGMKNPKQLVQKYTLFELPQRLWQYLCTRAGIGPAVRWLDLSKKAQNKLLEALYRDAYAVKGKTTFKEEFVTCGGVSLQDVDPQTMESRRVKGLYFAGEVLDIDGITGGFNFQAAWTTAWIAGSNM